MFELIRKLRKSKKEKSRYYSDILVNEPEETFSNFGVFIQDYTRNPSELLVDRKKFQEDEKPLIKICGYVAGLETSHLESSDSTLNYSGFIILGKNTPNVFPLRFFGFRDKKENENLQLEEMMLESAKSFPITMIGRFHNNPDNAGFIPYTFRPFVLKMGDYICPVPKAKKEESNLNSTK